MLLHERIGQIDGHRTVYFDSAAGYYSLRRPAAVLVPSMLLMARSYAATCRQLVRLGFRVVALELPGSGRSTRSAANWSFEDYAYWLACAVEEIGLSEPTLVGHSASAGVVLTCAARHPSHVGAVVVSDATGCRWHADHLWRIVAGRLMDAIDELAFGVRSAPDALYNATHHPRDFVHQLRLARLCQLHIAQRVHRPTLIAWGARDRTMPLRFAAELHHVISDASLYVSREGSHDWIVERAEEFARVVRAFVDDTVKPPLAASQISYLGLPVCETASGGPPDYLSTGIAG
jgi:pimeloyl-ACP methyl ester carboxylesterase